MNFEGPQDENKKDEISRRDFLRLGLGAAVAAKVGLEAESAQAVEIAENLSLEQGFGELQSGVFSDQFETAADAIVLRDGRTSWSYAEGQEGQVRTVWSESVVSTEGKSDELEIGIHVHNHPIHSIKTMSDLGSVLEGYSDTEIQNLISGPSWGGCSCKPRYHDERS